MLRVILTSFIVSFISQKICEEKIDIMPIRKHYILYNALAVFCTYSLFNAILWQYQINFLIVITFFYILSIAMYYVHEFRGTNINAADILSLNTAKEVAGGYTYEIRPIFVIVFFVIVAEYLLHIFIFKIDVFANYHKVINGIDSKNIDIYRFFWHEIGQVLCFFISFFILRDKITDSQFDYSLTAGENEGYIYNFFSSIPLFHKTKLSYDETVLVAKNFIADIFRRANRDNLRGSTNNLNVIAAKYRNYVKDNPDTPHVIVIMNESFGSVHRRVKSDTNVTSYYDNLEGAIKGNLYVNTFGGGTANTEFEFLTGMTIGNYPYPVMPYNNFVKRDKYSLARYFNNLGYKTIAMHPYTATNYHRNKVYKRFGFSDLYFFDDFRNKSYVRKFVSDESMYQEVIRRYRINKSAGNKIFLFGITMQNHSGYQNFEGANVLSHLSDYKNREAMDSYLSLMKISDEAIKTLIEYFRQETEHVILLFFGDHNASFGSEINKIVYETGLDYACTNPYVTPFFIYDNKNREEKFIKQTSANFLSLELLKKGNFPLDMLHELLNDLYADNYVYNYHKRRSRKDNKVYDIEMDKFMKLEREYLR